MASRLILLLFFVSISLVESSQTSISPICPRSELAFLDSIRARCPLWIERSFPMEINSETLDQELTHAKNGAYYSILFYANWCPFSRNFRPTFDTISSMYPQITHFSVEQSSALPSTFSRYGIHSVPAIVLASSTSKKRFSDSKDLNSLVEFYQKTTGLDPVAYFEVPESGKSSGTGSIWSQNQTLRELISAEPYLALSTLFLLLKLLAYLFPSILSHLKAFWDLHAPNIKLTIMGGSAHLLERVKRLCSKLNLFNRARNLKKGATNARVWASSFTSVSLGESSSSRRIL